MGQTCVKFIIKLSSQNLIFNRKTLRICFTTSCNFFSKGHKGHLSSCVSEIFFRKLTPLKSSCAWFTWFLEDLLFDIYGDINQEKQTAFNCQHEGKHLKGYFSILQHCGCMKAKCDTWWDQKIRTWINNTAVVLGRVSLKEQQQIVI